MPKLICIGECMIELRGGLGDRPTLGFGGDTLNTAVYAARVGMGAVEVAYATALGDDPYSGRMLAAWEEEGLSTRLVRRLQGRLPGFYTIETDIQGERRFYYWRDQAAVRSLLLPEADGDALLGTFAEADIVYLSGITLAILDAEQRGRLFKALEAHRGRGVRIAFDSNVRPALWPDLTTARDACIGATALADIVLVSLDDEQRLFDDADAEACARRLADAGVPEIVVKQGAAGALLSAGGRTTAIEAVAAPKVVDTTAAGDSFNGTYLARRLMGDGGAAAAQAAAQVASAVVEHPGALIPRAAMPG